MLTRLKGARAPSRLGKAEGGGTAILFAFLLPVLAAGGLGAADLTQLLNVGTALQDSADAAALAAVKVAAAGGADAAAAREASSIIDADFSSVKLDAGAPSASTEVSRNGPVTATVRAVSPVRLFFASAFGLRQSTLTRTAVAISQPADPVCLLILSPDASDAWSMQGTADIHGGNCASQVNSSSPRALSRNGNASASMQSIYVSGPAQSASGFSPAPSFGAPAVPDPIASRVVWPAARNCDFSNVSVTHTAQVLTPGTYCGGLDVSTHGSATLTPGVYVIQDGDLTITSHGALTAPAGVTIVLIGDASTITVQSGAELQVNAPTSGPWANLAIAVKPQSVERTDDLQGGGALEVDGLVYMPSQRLALTGGGVSTSTNRRILVVNSLQLRGNGRIELAGDNDILSGKARVRLAH